MNAAGASLTFGEEQRCAGRVQGRDHSVSRSLIGRLKRIAHRQVARSGRAGDVRVIAAIERDGVGDIRARAPKKC